MISRFHPLLWLGLLLVSCDKPQTGSGAEKQIPAGRTTKSNRPPPDELADSRNHLRAALKNADKNSSPQIRNQALASAVWEALELAPEVAREGFLKLTAGSPEKKQLIQYHAMLLSEQNLAEAVQWASTLETDEEKSRAFGNIALVLAKAEPERAARLLSDSELAGREFDVAVVQFVQHWAAGAPAEAAAWVVLFDAGEARVGGLKAVVSESLKTDRQVALAWVAAIQDPTIRREATRGMAEIILEQPEAYREEWLQIVSPETLSSVEKLKAAAAAR